MTELLLPEGTTVGSARDALAELLSVRDGRVIAGDRRFYDTFDGRLRAAGLFLAHRRAWFELFAVASGALRARARTGAPRGPLFASGLPEGGLRDALVELIGVRALLPVARVRSRDRLLDVLDGERKTVVRLLAMEPTDALSARLVVDGVRGYDAELASVLELLEGRLGFRVAEPLVDEAVRTAGGVVGGVSSKVDVGLSSGMRSDAAAAAVLSRLLEVMRLNLPGTLADLDSEFLHDFRVAVRRSRAVQRELRRAFPADALQRFRADFRWLQQVTGEARDLDVYVLDFEEFREMVPESMRADLDPLLAELRQRRARAHRSMNRALRSVKTAALVDEWEAFLGGLPALDVEGREAALEPIASVAGGRIRSVYRTMRRMGAAIDDASPAEDYHELRKKGKELRYLLELFGAPLFPAEVVKPMIKSLKSLQDVLGRHQDREVQRAELYSLAPSLERHPRTLLAMGALVQRLRDDELAARGEFAERFAAFASKSQRKLVRETFAS